MDYIAHQAPLSMGFPRQKQGSRFPFPSPGDLPNPGIEPRCPALQADSLPSKPQGSPIYYYIYIIYYCTKSYYYRGVIGTQG